MTPLSVNNRADEAILAARLSCDIFVCLERSEATAQVCNMKMIVYSSD